MWCGVLGLLLLLLLLRARRQSGLGKRRYSRLSNQLDVNLFARSRVVPCLLGGWVGGWVGG